MADITTPILGVNFLHHYGLLIDIKRQQLIDTKLDIKYIGCIKPATLLSPKVAAAEENSEFCKILSNYEVITKPKFNILVIKYDITHCIETTGPLVFSQTCP